MFSILGYIISIIIIAVVTAGITNWTKRFGVIQKLDKLFDGKIKQVKWYQVESILIALLILIILNALNIMTIGSFTLILNAVAIGFLSNGIFTYPLFQLLMLKLKITSNK